MIHEHRLVRRAGFDDETIVTVFLPAVVVMLVTYGQLFAVANRRKRRGHNTQMPQDSLLPSAALLAPNAKLYSDVPRLVAVAFNLRRCRRILFNHSALTWSVVARISTKIITVKVKINVLQWTRKGVPTGLPCRSWSKLEDWQRWLWQPVCGDFGFWACGTVARLSAFLKRVLSSSNRSSKALRCRIEQS